MLFDLLWEISIFFIRSSFEYRILFEHCVNAIYITLHVLIIHTIIKQ